MDHQKTISIPNCRIFVIHVCGASLLEGKTFPFINKLIVKRKQVEVKRRVHEVGGLMNMDKGGRPKNEIWQYFYEIRDGKKIGAKCKVCSYKLSNRADRMKIHMLKCSANSKNFRPNQATETTCMLNDVTLSTQTNNDNGMQDITEEDNLCGLQSQLESSCAEPHKSTQPTKHAYQTQSDMNKFVTKTNSGAKHALDIQVARFFFACNIPFMVSEHIEFVSLMNKLRPGYNPPSRKFLASGLLDEVTESVEAKLKQNLDGKECTLVEDGWSNIHNDPVTASCLHVDGKAFFLRAVDTGSNQKTGEYCAENVKQAVVEARRKYNCEVKTVVTDNAKNMEKMRRMLQAEDPDMLTYGCSSHWLNLLGHDITPSSIIKPIVEVQKFFRNHHAPSAWLKGERDTVKPQLPNDTRWNSGLTCINTYLRNRPAYMKIVEEHEDDIDSRISALINNYNLYKQAKDLLVQLQPIAISLDRLQGDSAGLSDACHEWLGLLLNKELEPYHNEVNARLKQAIQPFHYLAYLTDPKYKGERLSSDQKEKARMWLNEHQPHNLQRIIEFEAEAEPYPQSFFRITNANLKAHVWWKGLRNEALPNDFLKLMIRLHSCPCSSASIERIFSNFGLIHSKIRNRLGVQRAAKLVLCYRMLRGSYDLESDTSAL